MSWGVIQHHFGDRDGLLTAVIEDAVDRLIASLEVLSDPAQVTDTEDLVRATWEAFANPKAMAGLEILIATKELRTGIDGRHMQRLGAALAALMERLDTGANREHAVALGMLLWTTPVAMMIAEMFATPPLATKDAQKAIADLIDGRQGEREGGSAERGSVTKPKAWSRTGDSVQVGGYSWIGSGVRGGGKK